MACFRRLSCVVALVCEAPINDLLTDPFYLATGVWTGTLPNGTSAGSFTLGVNEEFGPMTGLSNKSNGEWIETSCLFSNQSMNMYGISQVLTVPAAVPEIDPAGTTAVLALVCGCLGLLERRRGGRRVRVVRDGRSHVVAEAALSRFRFPASRGSRLDPAIGREKRHGVPAGRLKASALIRHGPPQPG
ncbi:MAG: hypothetical protein ACKOTB_15145 [Planctomycetia bacterium]